MDSKYLPVKEIKGEFYVKISDFNKCMNSKQIEIDGMKELLKENELEIGRLRKEIKNLKEDTEHTINFNNKIIGELKLENDKLKEERDFFKEQATLWRNDYKNEYEENKKLKEENNELKEKIKNMEKAEKRFFELMKNYVMNKKD